MIRAAEGLFGGDGAGSKQTSSEWASQQRLLIWMIYAYLRSKIRLKKRGFFSHLFHANLRGGSVVRPTDQAGPPRKELTSRDRLQVFWDLQRCSEEPAGGEAKA